MARLKCDEGQMRRDERILSRDGGSFDCHVALPEATKKTPAIVLASAIFGVDADIRRVADEFAQRGYIAAAPNLFWRDGTGPLPMGDPRAAPRGEPRLEKIRTGEADLADVREWLAREPRFNGRAAVIGFCYGGPYAILGPKRLGYDAGISCHGTQMLDFVAELDGLQKPVCVLWGDQDVKAPPEVLAAYEARASRMSNVELHVFPGLLHGYTMRGNVKAFDQRAYDFSMSRAIAILEGLR
jgi:carboxymethylenebutenolidase